MDTDVLKEALKNNNIDKAIELIKDIGKNKYQKSLPILIEYMETTDNHLLRNTIAIALSDIGNPIAIKPLINTLKDTKTLGNRGTLLYALESFNCYQYIELFVDFMINGNFEESRESFILIESINSYISCETLNKCISKLEQSIEKLEEKIDFLSDGIDVLKELNNKYSDK